MEEPFGRMLFKIIGIDSSVSMDLSEPLKEEDGYYWLDSSNLSSFIEAYLPCRTMHGGPKTLSSGLSLELSLTKYKRLQDRIGNQHAVLGQPQVACADTHQTVLMQSTDDGSFFLGQVAPGKVFVVRKLETF